MENIPKHNYPLEKYQDLRQKFEDFAMSLPPKEQIDLLDKRMMMGMHLQSKYPDAKKHTFYHLLIGSTGLEFFDIIGDDFPGEDSVEAFIDSLINSK